MSEKSFIAEGLRRPSREHIDEGTEVFIVGKVVWGRVSIYNGEPDIMVEVGRPGGSRSISGAPLACVTVASSYALADDLRRAEARLSGLERTIAEIAAVVEPHCSDWQEAVRRVREILSPPDEVDPAA